MTKRRSSLTGSWSGAYRYPGDALPETVFNAQIEEHAGAFVGSMQEPNGFSSSLATVLIAEIEGVRTGGAVVFSKFYNDAGIKHAVRYHGEADANLTRIEGRWIIRNQWSGTFFMTRDDDGEAVEAEAQAEAFAPDREG